MQSAQNSVYNALNELFQHTGQTAMNIRMLKQEDSPQWLNMRVALWPETDEAQHRKEMAMMRSDESRYAVFVCEGTSGALVGFAEASLREWAEGCLTSPVGYLEGWFVQEAARRQGAGGRLLAACEDWARSKGCTEMASDTDWGNTTSATAHQRLGFSIAARLVAFRKTLE